MVNHLLHPVRAGGTTIRFLFNSAQLEGLTGDTVLSAILRTQAWIGQSEFSGDFRAGFCLMGSCQDCTIWDAGGRRFRACMEELSDGMELYSTSALDRLD